MDILKTYSLFKKMSQYPDLMGLIRTTFAEVLEQKEIVTRERLRRQAVEELKSGRPAGYGGEPAGVPRSPHRLLCGDEPDPCGD